MAAEVFEFGRAKWVTDVINYPLVICPQPHGHVISLIFQSGWGGSTAEIQSLKVQNREGQIVDILIADKWYLNPDLFPDSISFPLVTSERPGEILFQNGIAQKGIKRMVVMYDDEQIWAGDVPMATGDNPVFSIPLPVNAPEFQRPSIKMFRSTKTIDISLD
jgi:hypothetical protein